MMLHGSLDARNFSLRTIHTPNATRAEPTSLGTQYAHICRNGSLDHKHSWGHPSFFFFFFPVLEGPLSGDTHPSTPHRINPAVHHQIFFFTAPLFIFYLPLFFPTVFFFFSITYWSPHRRRHCGNSRDKSRPPPASLAFLSQTAWRHSYNLLPAAAIVYCF